MTYIVDKGGCSMCKSTKKSMMTIIVAMISLLICSFLCVGCGSTKQAAPADKKIKVVATTTMLADLARQVGGDKVEVQGLMKPGVDPHVYSATTADVQALEQADVIVYNGVELEGKLEETLENLAKKNKVVINASSLIPENTLLDFEEDGEVGKDPHIWFSVNNWKMATQAVVKGLSEKDSANKAYYEAQGKAYTDKLTALDAKVKEQIASIPETSRVLVTAHDALGYFSRDYGIAVKGIQGVTTEDAANAADVDALANFIADHKIKAIFVESSVPTKSIEALQEAVAAKGWQVTVGGELFTDSLGDEGTEQGTYIGMMQYDVDTIVQALK